MGAGRGLLRASPPPPPAPSAGDPEAPAGPAARRPPSCCCGCGEGSGDVGVGEVGALGIGSATCSGPSGRPTTAKYSARRVFLEIKGRARKARAGRGVIVGVGKERSTPLKLHTTARLLGIRVGYALTRLGHWGGGGGSAICSRPWGSLLGQTGGSQRRGRGGGGGGRAYSFHA